MLSDEDSDEKIVEFDVDWFLQDREKINNSLFLSDIFNLEDLEILKTLFSTVNSYNTAINPHIHHRWYYLSKTPGEDTQKMMKDYLKNKLEGIQTIR